MSWDLSSKNPLDVNLLIIILTNSLFSIFTLFHKIIITRHDRSLIRAVQLKQES